MLNITQKQENSFDVEKQPPFRDHKENKTLSHMRVEYKTNGTSYAL